MTPKKKACSRRTFLACAAAPLVVAPRVWGDTAPSRCINIGMLGMGRQGTLINLPTLLEMPDVRVRAVCDVDAWRRDNAQQQVEKHYGQATASGAYKGCRAYTDFRDVLARDDIDAVMISTPDHWHGPMALAAMQAGKDVSCEKPISFRLREGRLLATTATRRGRIFRTDSEFRSLRTYRQACELAINGVLGKLRAIHAQTPPEGPMPPDRPIAPPPPELNYDLWLGPAPEAPYSVNRVHISRDLTARPGWLRISDYSQGMICNWGAHLNDIAQWACGTERTGPVEVRARGAFPPAGALWDNIIAFEVEYLYINGVRLFYRLDPSNQPGIRFVGDLGWVEVLHGRGIRASNKQWLKWTPGENDLSLPGWGDKEDFIRCVKSRATPMEDAEIGHRANSLAQIALAAIQCGERALRWDPDTECFPDHAAANRWLERPPMRGDWMDGLISPPKG